MEPDLFGPVLGIRRQVVEGVMRLSDATEQHSDHTCNTPGGTEINKTQIIDNNNLKD